MKKTTVEDWSIIHIQDKLSPFKVLWAIVIQDSDLEKGHYICTSRILFIEQNQVRTHTGSTYELIGKGREYHASYAQLILLIEGHSPAELNLEVVI